jgi:hypothetical protein
MMTADFMGYPVGETAADRPGSACDSKHFLRCNAKTAIRASPSSQPACRSRLSAQGRTLLDPIETSIEPSERAVYAVDVPLDLDASSTHQVHLALDIVKAAVDLRDLIANPRGARS